MRPHHCPLISCVQLSSKVGTKFSYAKFNVDKGQLTADGGRVLETSLVPCPNVKMTFKANKGADLGAEYSKSGLCATAVLDVMDMSKLSASACYGLGGGLNVGGDATIGLKDGGIAGFNVGASYATGPLFTSVVAAPKSSKCDIGLLYKVNSQLTLASLTTHSTDKICTVSGVGGAYKSSIGTIKAKYNSAHVVSAAFTREIAPKVTLTASGSVKPTDLSTFKPGLSISM